MDVIQEVKDTILQEVDGEAVVHVLDPRNDGVHLEALVVSEKFTGLSLVKQQQLVMQALKAHFATSLHALGLRTFTPEKWEASREKYGF